MRPLRVLSVLDSTAWHKCTGNQGLLCHIDAAPLFCIDDYAGGGSHYWFLFCQECKRLYTYSNYDYELREWVRQEF